MLIKCLCGCGSSVNSPDARGRPRKYVRGHSSRCCDFSYERQCKRCGKIFRGTVQGQRYCSEACHFPNTLCACGCGNHIQIKSLAKNKSTRYLPGHHWIGRKHTEEELRKICGYGNGLWLGKRSTILYSKEFRSISRKIAKFSGRICQLCGDYCDKGRGNVHHINFDKTDDSENNLIFLCINCHLKAHRWQTRDAVASELLPRSYGILLASAKNADNC